MKKISCKFEYFSWFSQFFRQKISAAPFKGSEGQLVSSDPSKELNEDFASSKPKSACPQDFSKMAPLEYSGSISTRIQSSFWESAKSNFIDSK